MRMNVAVILAGGVGNRVGASIPKQFIEVLGKPIIAYSIDPFEANDDIDAILVVCVKPYVDYIWELKEKYNFTKINWVTEGGDSFQASVMNGVNFLFNKIAEDDTVLFHFAASPFISSDIISDAISVCKERGTNAISTTDYYLLSGEKKSTSSVNDHSNYTEKYIDRDTIAVMNTPHAFRFGYIYDLYKRAVRTGIIDNVEPHTTTLMYAMGEKIFFSKGSQTNIKITTKEDLKLFEGYVLSTQRSKNQDLDCEVVIFVAEGFEECEALLVADILRRAGIKALLASTTDVLDVKSSREILIHTDCLAENIDYSNVKMLVLPGGRKGTKNISNSEFVKEKCVRFAKDRYIAALCSAPSILADLGILEGKSVTIHPDYVEQVKNAIVENKSVVVDENIVTGQGLGATIPFSLKLVELLIDVDRSQKIAKDICFI